MAGISTPTDAMSEYLSKLPAIPEDPENRDPGDDDRDIDAEDETFATATYADNGEGDTDTATETAARARDEQGRFTKAETDGKPVETATETAVSKTDTETATADPAAERERLMGTLTADEQKAFAFATALAQAPDPIEFLAQQAISSNLKDALLEKLGVKAEAQDTAPAYDADYEPSPIEEVLLPHLKHLQTFPESVAAFAQPVMQQAIGEYDRQITPYVDAANIEALVFAEQTKAVAEALGLDLPPVDRRAVLSALAKNDKLTYADAVTSVIGDSFKKAVADFKQANKPRPETPGNISDSITIEDLPRDRDKYGVIDGKDIFRLLNGVPPRRR